MSQVPYSDSDRSVLQGMITAAVGVVIVVLSNVVRATVEPPLVGGGLFHGILWVAQGLGIAVVFGGVFVLIRGQIRRSMGR